MKKLLVIVTENKSIRQCLRFLGRSALPDEYISYEITLSATFHV
jgi:hypothetical protein